LIYKIILTGQSTGLARIAIAGLNQDQRTLPELGGLGARAEVVKILLQADDDKMSVHQRLTEQQFGSCGG